MKRDRADLWVGLFVLAAGALLMWGTLLVGGGPSWFGPEGYRLVARFADVSGLNVETDVMIAGVAVGKVANIDLEGRSARVTLRIDAPDVTVPIDSLAAIRSRGLLGERVLEIVPGPSEEVLPSGGVITRTRPAGDVDELIETLTAVAEDVEHVSATFRNVLGGPEGEEAVREIVGNARALTANLRSVVEKNTDRFDRIAVNLDTFSAEVAELTAENREAVVEFVSNLRDASARLSKTLDHVETLASRVERGEGSLGKLLADDELYEEVDLALADARAALRELRRAAEETQEQIPSTILLSVLGALF